MFSTGPVERGIALYNMKEFKFFLKKPVRKNVPLRLYVFSLLMSIIIIYVCWQESVCGSSLQHWLLSSEEAASLTETAARGQPP